MKITKNLNNYRTSETAPYLCIDIYLPRPPVWDSNARLSSHRGCQVKSTALEGDRQLIPKLAMLTL